MPWATPRTWVATYKLTAATFNLEIRDKLNFLISKPRVSLIATSVSSITTATWTAMTWVTEVADTDTMWSGGLPTRIYFTTAGTYRIHVSSQWSVNASGARILQVNKNSTGTVGSGTAIKRTDAPASPTQGCCELDVTETFAAGDYIEAFRYQSSGGNLAPSFAGTYDNSLTAELVSIP